MNMVIKGVKKLLIAIVIPGSLFLLFMLLVPDRIGVHTLLMLLQQAIIPAIVAWGVCFLIECGLWDFSVGAVVVMSGIIGGNLALMFGFGIVGIIVFCSLIGLILGSITGSVFTLLRVPSIVVTIGMLLILESLSTVVFKGRGAIIPEEYLVLGKFPINVIIGACVFLFAYYLFNYRKFGYQVRAIGNGTDVARSSGINISKVRLLCFSTTGLFAGIYASVTLGISGISTSISNMASIGIMFSAMICVLIGRAIDGSVNLIIGVYIGSITMQILKIGIMATGLPGTFEYVIVSFLVLIFLAFKTRQAFFRKIMMAFQRRRVNNL